MHSQRVNWESRMQRANCFMMELFSFTLLLALCMNSYHYRASVRSWWSGATQQAYHPQLQHPVSFIPAYDHSSASPIRISTTHR
ncbi:hypothetical protein BDV18DRAFT_116039 [Aspergillus unguis]